MCTVLSTSHQFVFPQFLCNRVTCFGTVACRKKPQHFTVMCNCSHPLASESSREVLNIFRFRMIYPSWREGWRIGSWEPGFITNCWAVLETVCKPVLFFWRRLRKLQTRGKCTNKDRQVVSTLLKIIKI